MKNNSLVFIYLFCFLISQHIVAQSGYVIKGSIKELANPTYAYLSIEKNDNYLLIDSTKVIKGKFIFRGSLAEPNLYYVSIKEVEGGIAFMLDNALIHIEAQASQLGKAAITGSPLAAAYKVCLDQYTNPAKEEIKKNYQKIRDLKAVGDTVGIQACGQSIMEILKQQVSNAENYFTTHPDSFISLYLLNAYWREYDIETAQFYLQSLSAPLQAHSIARELIEKWKAVQDSQQRTAISKVSQNFSQADTTGQMVSLWSFKGRYVLLDFWASWCAPCRQESPLLVKAYEKYKPKGFDILSVSLDKDRTKWIEAINKDKLVWTHVSDLQGGQNQVCLLYGIEAIPANFLIDPQGKIIAKGLRGQQLERKLEEIFGEKG